MPDVDLREFDFTSLSGENLIGIAEDFVRALPFVTRDPPRSREEDRIDLVSEVVSRAGESPTGLSPQDATTLANTFRQALLHLRLSSSSMESLWTRIYVHALLRGSHIFPGVELSTGPPDFDPLGLVDVWKGNYHGNPVCIKAIRMRKKSNLEKIKKTFSPGDQERRYSSHPNIIPIVQVSEGLFPFCVMSPWMTDGDIVKYTQSNSGANRLMLLTEVCSALSHLHELDLLHGCIAPGNILISRDGRACLGDFGIVGNFGKLSFPSFKLGTARYMAVERMDLTDGSPSKKSDIYSLAMTSFTVLTGVTPYDDVRGHYSLKVRIQSGERPSRPKHLDGVQWLQDRIWVMITACWSEDPDTRWEVSAMQELFRMLSLQGVQKIKSDIKTGGQRRSSRGFRPRITSFLQTLVVSESEIKKLINEMDERLETETMPAQERRKLFNKLCKTCSQHRFIPKSMHIPDCPRDDTPAAYTGGFSNVYRSRYEEYQVAVKVVKVVTSNLNAIYSGFCREVVAWKHLRHPNILPLLGVTINDDQFAMVSEWMDNGNITEFVQKDYDANRIALLADVANGLEYMHDLRIVHGDLKGANILINKDRRACIADFSLTTVTGVGIHTFPGSSPVSTFSEDTLMSFTGGGTRRWMSPELLDPEQFGIPQSEGDRPTRQSDCYALGMVIYEVLCGHHPFIELTQDNSLHAVVAILDGKRPQEPAEAARLGFKKELWAMVERCWRENRAERPNVEEILSCLNDATEFWYRRNL